MIKYLREWFKTQIESDEAKIVGKDIALLTTDLRLSYAQGHQMEAAHQLKLQEIAADLAKFTPQTRRNIEKQLRKITEDVILTPETVVLMMKIADLVWLNRVLALPKVQQLRFMLAETDDSQKYNVKQ